MFLLLDAPIWPASAIANHRVRKFVRFAAADCTARCGSGSTVGPDGALYVTDGPGGRLLRVDQRTGAVRTVTSDLAM